MSRSKCSRELYAAFLDVTTERYSALSLSEIAPAELSHDSISRWLVAERVQPKDLWAAAKKEVYATPGILVFDDVVIDKSRSGKTELVNWQYSGAKHDITKGIGVVNALWQTSQDQYVPMDYRIWNPPDDGKTKTTISGICWPLQSSASYTLKWSWPTVGIPAWTTSRLSAPMAGTGSWGLGVTGWLASRTSSYGSWIFQMRD